MEHRKGWLHLPEWYCWQLLLFCFPFAHQCNLFAWNTNEINKWIYILNQDGRQISDQTVVGVQIRAVAASQYQSFSGEKVTVRIDTEIKSYRVFSSPVMNILQGFLG